jgi:hypothetical protein
MLGGPARQRQVPGRACGVWTDDTHYRSAPIRRAPLAVSLPQGRSARATGSLNGKPDLS